jgi:hypothetical protein
MDDQEIHSVAAADVSQAQPLGRALLALNNAHARELSWLEPARLEYLVSVALLARRTGELDAFLLAFDQDARYDSPNFLWCSATIWMGTQRQSGWPFRRSRRGDDCRGPAITQGIFS